jgi:hypothetical protein
LFYPEELLRRYAAWTAVLFEVAGTAALWGTRSRARKVSLGTGRLIR